MRNPKSSVVAVNLRNAWRCSGSSRRVSSTRNSPTTSSSRAAWENPRLETNPQPPPAELDEGLDVGPAVTGLRKPEAHADAPAEQRADGGGPVAGGVELGGDLSPGRGTEGDDPVDPEDPGQFPEQR